MAIQVTCPSCEHQFKVPDQYAGKKGRCPKCKEVFSAPDLDVFEEVEDDDEGSVAGNEWLAEEPAPPPPVPAKQPVPAKKPDAPLPQVKSGKRKSSSGGAGGFDLGSLDDSLGASAPSPAVKLAGPARSAASRAGGKTSARRKKSGGPDDDGLPKWVLPVGIGGAVFALLLGLGLVFFFTGGDDTPELADGDTPAGQENTPADSGNDTDPGSTPAVDDTPPPEAAPADLLTAWSELHDGMVWLTIEQGAGSERVPAFLVDSRGYVVAHYHDIAAPGVSAVKAEVEGLGTIEIEGAVAGSRQLDLVLLKVKMLVPVPLQAFELAEAEPGARQSLYAAGMEKGKAGLTATLFERIVQTRELPQSAKAVLREQRINDEDPLYWVETSVPTPEAAIGGPLLDAQGKVIGVTTQLSPNSPHGYAIHVRHIAELLEHARSNPVPLESDALAQLQDDLPGARPGTGDVATTDPEDTTTDPGDDPGGKPFNPPDDPGDGPGDGPGEEGVAGLQPPTEAEAALGVETIAHAVEVCQSFDFTPKSQAEYDWLVLVALFIDRTEDYIENYGSDVPEAQAAELRAAVQSAIAALEALEFDDARMEAVNQFAQPALEGPPGTQVFFYGRVTIESSEFNVDGGGHAVMLTLEGSGLEIILPVSNDAHAQMKNGSHWLVMGSTQTPWSFTNAEIGVTKQVPMVLCRYIIGKQ